MQIIIFVLCCLIGTVVIRVDINIPYAVLWHPRLLSDYRSVHPLDLRVPRSIYCCYVFAVTLFCRYCVAVRRRYPLSRPQPMIAPLLCKWMAQCPNCYLHHPVTHCDIIIIWLVLCSDRVSLLAAASTLVLADKPTSLTRCMDIYDDLTLPLYTIWNITETKRIFAFLNSRLYCIFCNLDRSVYPFNLL